MKQILLLILMVVLSGCNTIDLNQLGQIGSALDTAFIPASEDDEQEAGRDAASILLGASPVLDDAALNRYVNRVGRWVALHSDRPDLNWRFAVLDDQDINAFAAPGGYVFITKGMLARLGSEAELAGVLGHEIAHVTEKHHLAAMRKQAGMKLVGIAASAAMEDQGYDSEKLAPLAKAAKNMYSRGLDRKDEYRADRLGVVLAARAGYDPYGLPAVLQTLDRMNPDSGALSLLIKTHPRPADRLQRLDEAMLGRLDNLTGSVGGRERFGQIMASLAAETDGS